MDPWRDNDLLGGRREEIQGRQESLRRESGRALLSWERVLLAFGLGAALIFVVSDAWRVLT
jgi:hypothetical protein